MIKTDQSTLVGVLPTSTVTAFALTENYLSLVIGDENTYAYSGVHDGSDLYERID